MRRRVKRVLIIGKAHRRVRRILMMGKARMHQGAQFGRLLFLVRTYYEKENSATVHHRKIKSLAKELFTVKENLSKFFNFFISHLAAARPTSGY